MKLLTIFSLVLGLASIAAANAPAPDGKAHKFTLHDGQFWVDDTPMRIFSGEIHPGRVPAQFWDDRIKKAKAMGLNTVCVYLFWNQIEPTEGNFVFEDNTDVRGFVKLCQDNGMWCIVRAGPYICGEWEFGGFPAWMLKDKTIQLRTDNPKYLAYCDQYVQKLSTQIADLQVNHGGPIIMVQIENELHAINPYLKDLQDMFVKAGFNGQLMTCDPSGNPWRTIEGLPNLLRGYNGFDGGNSFAMRYGQIQAVNKPTGYPIFSPEVYTGWFNTWGPVFKQPVVAADRQVKDTQFLLDHKDISWNYYVFDGGTNFGFMSGANNGVPMQTSYDYDAPVDELGRVTPKYKALRDLFIKNLNLTLPDIPADPNVIEIPAFTLKQDAPLLAHLPQTSLDSNDVQSMEDLGQDYGFVDYRKQFDAGIHGKLTLTGARDYSQVMLNGKVVGEELNRGNSVYTLPLDQDGPTTLDILVHNFGRDSLISAPVIGARYRKGLNQNPTLDGTALTGWKMYSLPMDDPSSLPAGAPATDITGPTFFSGTFTLNDVGETYLDMSNFHCGVVWVNGHNLGRYWDVGNGRAIYLPSVWENKGDNNVEILELGKPPATAQISGVMNMVQTPAVNFKPLWIAAGTLTQPPRAPRPPTRPAPAN